MSREDIEKKVSNCCGAEYEYKEHYYDNHRGAFVCHRCGKICTVING